MVYLQTAKYLDEKIRKLPLNRVFCEFKWCGKRFKAGIACRFMLPLRRYDGKHLLIYFGGNAEKKCKTFGEFTEKRYFCQQKTKTVLLC